MEGRGFVVCSDSKRRTRPHVRARAPLRLRQWPIRLSAGDIPHRLAAVYRANPPAVRAFVPLPSPYQYRKGPLPLLTPVCPLTRHCVHWGEERGSNGESARRAPLLIYQRTTTAAHQRPATMPPTVQPPQLGRTLGLQRP